MLNKSTLSSILGQTVNCPDLDDIHWQVQSSTSTSLFFYRIGTEPKAIELFVERMRTADFGWLIVNRTYPGLPKNATVISESLWPEVQKKCLDVLYPLPALKLIAITGTNGKTTTTDLVLQLGEMMGKKGMSVGTLGVRENHKTILDFGLTSPPLIDLRKYLAKFGKGKDFCVMEASSHALHQRRLEGLSFDAAGWLSFTQDHLDYHKSMDEYFEAKCLLLKQLSESARLFVPKDQLELREALKLKSDKIETAPEILDRLPLFFQTRFNRNNLEVAAAILANVFKTQVPGNWEKITPPDGRFFIRQYKSSYIVVDFAHTPDALENICLGIKEAFPGYRLKVLFGCGGDRDRAKRPLMGKIADTLGDELYVTSDNPRSEDPNVIIDDIIQGIQKKRIHRIVERPLAVDTAFSELKDKEVLLLAGKGHEDYILIKGVKHHYSDIEEVEKFLARNKA